MSQSLPSHGVTLPLRPCSWWFAIASVILAVAGFLCLLSITATVRGVEDLAPLRGTVAQVVRDQRGNLIITLVEPRIRLQLLRSDQDALDEHAFHRDVLPGAPVTAHVLAARLREGRSLLTLFGLSSARAVYLAPEPLIADRRHEGLVVLPSIALVLSGAAAITLWLGFRDLRRQLARLLNSLGAAAFTVGTGLIAVVGGLTLLQFGAFTTLAWLSNQRVAAVMLAAIAVVGIVVIASSGTISVDAEAITVRAVCTRHQMRWAEVTELVVESGQLVFRGADKRLVVPAPWLWSGPERLLFADYLGIQLRLRNIPSRASAGITFTHSRNTRVR